MDRERFGKIWTVVGATTTYLLLNAWLETQQGKLELPGITFEKHNDGSTAVLSLVIGGILFRVLVSVWNLYLKDFPGTTFYDRLPPLAGWDFDVCSAIGKRIQIVFLLVFLVLPLASLVHLNLEVYRESTCERVDDRCDEIVKGGTANHLLTYVPLELGQYKYRLGTNGIQYHPFWEDWLLLLWHLYLQICGWSLMWRVVAGRSLPSEGTA